MGSTKLQNQKHIQLSASKYFMIPSQTLLEVTKISLSINEILTKSLFKAVVKQRFSSSFA